MEWLDKKEELEQLLIVQKKSYVEVGRLYNISGAAIKKAAIRLGLNLPYRRKINPTETFGKGIIKVPVFNCINCGKEARMYASKRNKFCSFKCQHEYYRKSLYRKIIEGDPSIMKANYNPAINFKPEIIKEQGGICAICGCIPKHNNKPLVFILDHIDGNAANNRRDNLRCVCPNCDSQLDTYKSKNKNGVRSYYRYHKWEKEGSGQDG